jgi:hypothetical protein
MWALRFYVSFIIWGRAWGTRDFHSLCSMINEPILHSLRYRYTSNSTEAEVTGIQHNKPQETIHAIFKLGHLIEGIDPIGLYLWIVGIVIKAVRADRCSAAAKNLLNIISFKHIVMRVIVAKVNVMQLRVIHALNNWDFRLLSRYLMELHKKSSEWHVLVV